LALSHGAAFTNVTGARETRSLKEEPPGVDNQGGRVRRYELQLWEPDKGGWRTVLTAVDAEMLQRSARTLGWQTQKPIRVLGPDGVVPDRGSIAPRG
jgi:hypothetical protein